jgi:hypothetical protein
MSVTSYADPKLLIGEAQRLQRIAIENTAFFPSYIGPIDPRPAFLLLGDKRGETRYGRPSYPSAFVPYRDTSGHYLMTALHNVGLANFGIANAVEERLNALWTTLWRPRVVALGRNAEYACKRANVPIAGIIDHPQYWRRFNYGQVAEYGKRIWEVCHDT